MRWTRSRILFFAVSMAIIASLISLLVIVPLVFGEQFISLSFQPEYFDGPGQFTMEIVYVNGSIIPIVCICALVNVTNSYFRPVHVKYHFEFVWLIYNRTVNDPSDVVSNKPFLVWGAFYALHALSDTFDLSESWAYNYYVAHRSLSDFTQVIEVGTYSSPTLFGPDGTTPGRWYGQNLNINPISPGTYYIYCIAYGKRASEPFNLTVTSVLWKR